MKKHLVVRIFGRVQGVWFRRSAQIKAKRLELFGFAKNLPDGSVYIEVEGKREALKTFLAWCRKGSLLARVKKVDFEYSSFLKGFGDFEVR